MALPAMKASSRERFVLPNDALHLCKIHRLNRIENAKVQSIMA
jgi:hypothetical protein